MVIVTPLKSFDHNGVRRKGVPFECSMQTATALQRAKLVTLGEAMEENPLETVEPSLSASLPVLPSPQTIAKPSNIGAKRGRKKKGQ